MSGDASTDKYAIQVWGASTSDPVEGVWIDNLQLRGRYDTNPLVLGTHGVIFKNARRCGFGRLWVNEMQEEGVVLSDTTQFQGSQLCAYHLGSGAMDIGGVDSKHVSVELIVGERCCMEENDGVVNISDFAYPGQYPSFINIGRVVCINPGYYGVFIGSARHVSIDQISVLGNTDGTRDSCETLRIYKSSVSPEPEHITIGSVTSKSVGKAAPDPIHHNVHVLSGLFVSIGRIHIQDSYINGLAVSGTSRFCQFDQVLVDGGVDVGQNPAPHAVTTAKTSADNIFGSITVRDWAWGSGSGSGLVINGNRNIVDAVKVGATSGSDGADSWDIVLNAPAENNIIGHASISGDGIGGIFDGGKGTILGLIQKGTGGASYKPYQAAGLDTIASGTTSKAVTHNLGFTPSARHITVTPTNNPTNDSGHIWISDITAAQFKVNCRADPGASGLAFAWQARAV
jgi:hypothetical protein